MSEKAFGVGPMPEAVPLVPVAPAVRARRVRIAPTFLVGLVLLGLLILGTDNFGRDIWSRIAYSPRLDLQIGLLSVLFPFVFGGLMGIATGYLGGKLDTLLMRIVDVLMAFPFLILVIAI